MLYFEIISGAVLCFVGFLCVIAAVEEPAALIFAAIAGVGGGFLLSAGIHRDWDRGQAAHVALYQAATGQGYHVRGDGVHTGYWSSIDVRAGRCLFSLEARKVDGRWRFGVDESGQGSEGGIVFLSPADVAKFREVCPS